jgi:DNA (cytosine-5)-methyltransferase 1
MTTKIPIFIKPKVSHPKFIEVCAGCGGLSTGLTNAGFTPVLLNENDIYCCQTLLKNHPDVNINKNSMLDLDLRCHQNIDLLTGGVPCQSFSQAGKRAGLADGRGQLLPYFNVLVKQCMPKVFMIENVKGLQTHEKGKTLSDIVKLLENNGLYRVQYNVLNAVNYSVPQKRERLFIIGVRSDINKTFVFPKEHAKKLVLRDVLSNVPPSLGYSYPDTKKIVMDLVPPGGCWVNLPEDIQKNTWVIVLIVVVVNVVLLEDSVWTNHH